MTVTAEATEARILFNGPNGKLTMLQGVCHQKERQTCGVHQEEEMVRQIIP